jgi:pSer/pThr/pTyr-binding forkhead associated (FHA) protein
MARLVVLSEGMTGRTLELKVERTTVGRIEDNLFQIPEASVSSHHCEILLRGGDILVKDLGSTNGTFIDGQQITEAVIKPGQILRLGQVQMRLESGTPAAPSKKALDHTMVIPQGVKLNELEQGGAKAVKFETTSPFGKKSNKTNLIFIVIGVLLGLTIIGLLIYAFSLM